MPPYNNLLPQDTLHQALKIVSYVPIALFAENLRVQRALLTCICSRSLLNLPVTGSVKDLTRLWNLNEFDLFGKFDAFRSSSQVSSVRNGNSFPLVNEGLLEVAGLVSSVPQFPNAQHARPTTLRVTFITPARSSSTVATSKMYWVRNIVNVLHLIIHLTLGVLLAYHSYLAGTILMLCMSFVDVLQTILRHSTSAVFARASAPEGKPTPLQRNDPLDVHIITPSWNASSMDVLVGTSTQLHELTNRPLRTTRPKLVKWILRTLDAVLVVQAATLASLSGTGTAQAISSLVWLACYVLMLITSRLINAHAGGLFLESQPGNICQPNSLVFSGRSVALAFINTLPVNKHDGAGFSWMDNFIPPNKRREQWLQAVMESSLMNPEDDEAKASETERTRMLVEEIREKISDASFQAAFKEFEAFDRTTQT